MFKAALLITTFLCAQAIGQNLPSANTDDYDREKYEKIVSDASYWAQQAADELSRTQEVLKRTEFRENELKQQIEIQVKELQERQARVKEAQETIKHNNDAESALNAKIAKGNQEIGALQQSINDLQASLNRLNSMMDGLKSDYNSKKSALDALQSVAKTKHDAAVGAEAKVQAQNALIEQLQRDYDAAPADKKAAIKTNLDAALAALPGMMTARTQAENDAKSAQDAVNAKSPETDQAKSRLDAAVTEQNQAQTKLKEANANLAKSQADVEAVRTQLSKNQNQSKELQKVVETSQREIFERQRSLQQQEETLRKAMAETNQRRYEMAAANQNYGVRLRDLEAYRRRLDDVNRMIEAARIEIERVARMDGAADGSREGRELGEAKGLSEGQAQGTAKGQADGEAAGRSRDYNTGAEEGRGLAITKATQDGTDSAEAEAKINGPTDGTRDGLEAAYNQGRQEGLENGEKTGSDVESYKKGHMRGETEGLAKAVEEAKPQEPIGYSKRESQYLNADLKKVTVGEASPLSKNFSGAQGRFSQPGDDRYYQPRPAQYPHPRLTSFYQVGYDDAYRRTLEGVYEDSRTKARDVAYNASYQAAYRNAEGKSYPDSRQQGKDDAYNKTYTPVFNDIKAKEYAIRYKNYRDAAFEIARQDKPQHDRGFADGNAIASEQKGYKDGFSIAYEGNKDKELEKAFNRGIERADALYAKNPVIRVVSIDIRDADGDGVYRPGEAVQPVYVVKNFGLVAKTDLNSEAEASGPATVAEARSQIPAIGGQTETTVMGRPQVVVNPSAEDRSPLSLRFRLVDDKGEVSSQTFRRETLMPVGTQMVNFDGVLSPGDKTVVSVSVQNRSQLPQNLKVLISVDPTKVDVTKSTQDVNTLAPGDKATVNFELIGHNEAEFDESSIAIQVQQNNVLFGKMASKGTIIRRHRVHSDAKGLVLASNLVKSGKALYSLEKFDTWDLRVDGSLMAIEQLTPYKDKLVHVMADPSANLDNGTLNTLVTFVSRGGSLVVWGADMDQSGVFSQLQPYTQTRADAATNINNIVTGALPLADISLAVRKAGALAPQSVRVRSVLVSPSMINGVSSFMDGYAEKVGHIYLMAIDTAEMTAQVLRVMMETLDVANQPFENKLNMAAQTPAKYMKYLLMDIQEEMLMAESDRSKDFYDDKDKENKIYRSLLKFVKGADEDSEVRKTFAAGYPKVMEILALMKNKKAHDSAADVIDSGFGFFWGNTWKKDFCRDNEKHALCQ